FFHDGDATTAVADRIGEQRGIAGMEEAATRLLREPAQQWQSHRGIEVLRIARSDAERRRPASHVDTGPPRSGYRNLVETVFPRRVAGSVLPVLLDRPRQRYLFHATGGSRNGCVDATVVDPAILG